MLEIPESNTIAEQLNQTIKGKTIQKVVVNASPHRFAFYYEDPNEYEGLLVGKTIDYAEAVAGQIEIVVQDARILFGDGVNVRFFKQRELIPAKHQLYIEFNDCSCIVCTVQMYGGLWAFKDGENDNPYYLVAKEKPSPLTEQFDEDYFMDIINHAKATISIKAVLATEQRIPGLGNGVLQDILFRAKLNPKSKLSTLSEKEKRILFQSVKETIMQMAQKGGRDTEKDLFGCNGGYKTVLSNKTLKYPCTICGGEIIRQAYMGGNVYYCPHCQPLKK